MKYNLNKLLLVIVGLLLSTTALAHDFEVDGIYYNYLDESSKTVEVTYKGSSYYDYSNEYTGSVIIPSSVTYNDTTYSVTSIGNSAFEDCYGLTEVTIPNSVTEIGGSAFYGCTGLTSVTIPNSVTEIGSGAFYYCYGLTEVTIPNSVTEIGSYAFYNCDGLTEVTIPNSVTEIGSYAFYNCDGLTEVTIPNSVTEIGGSAFYKCTGLTSVTIPNSVTEIGGSAFYGCTGLTEVTIPNSVTSIGSYAFYGTAWYNNQVDGVIYINNILYEYKGTMPEGTSISIKDGTVLISPSAFSGCTGLTSVTIPNSVTTIGGSAFSGCTGLTSVTIPNSVTEIGSYAFEDCTGLTSVTIPNSVTSIGSEAFSGCTGLTSVTIPNSVTTIGSGAFYGCTGLTEVTIPNSVTEIGSEAFYGCTGLTEVTIPNSVTEIGSYAFYKCENLKLVINLSNLTFSKGSSNYGYIAYYADRVVNAPNGSIDGDFVWRKANNTNTLVAYLGNDTEVILPTDCNGENYTIGSYAFEDCTGLTSVTIPNSVTEIGGSAFSGCTGLTSVTIPNSVTEIGGSAFSGCTGLTEVNYNAENCTSMGSSDYPVFRNCSNLKTLNIGNEVKNIPSYAFKYCTGLTSVTIGNSVTSIGYDAFHKCEIRLIMNHCATPPTCSEGAFDGSYTALLMIPEGSLIDYALADEWHKFTQVHEVSEAKVSTEEKSATFEIPTIEGATQYLASVYSDASMSQLVATTHYDAYGKIIPMSTSLELSIDGFDDGVYYYKVLVKSAEGEILKNYIGTFEIDAAGVENIATDDAVEVSRYDIHGRLLNEPTRGINIVIYSDGTTRKEIVK